MRIACEFTLFGRDIFAALAHDSFAVAKNDVLAPDAQLDQHLQARDPGSSCSESNDAYRFELLFRHAQRVHRGSGDNDRRPVLIVMEYRYVHALPTALLHKEAIRRFDVLQIDRAEGWFKLRNQLRKFFRILLINLDIEAIDVREFLEQNGLAFHDGLCRASADVPKAEHCGSVRYHRDEIASAGVSSRVERLVRDFDACFGNPRRVSERQVPRIRQRLRRSDLQLSRPRQLMIV